LCLRGRWFNQYLSKSESLKSFKTVVAKATIASPGMKEHKYPRISVIIPTRDRRDILSKVLASYAGQDIPPRSFEVIVVDDGSTDGTGKMVEEFRTSSPFDLTCIRREAGGPARARNAGIEKARGALLLFSGDDMIASPQLVAVHLEGHGEWPGSVILGHIDWHPSLEITPFMRYINTRLQFNYPRIKSERMNVSYPHFYASNLSMNKSIVEDIGAFDEDFPDAAFEDIELGYRIWKKGIRTIYNERAVAYHYHPTDLAAFIKRQLRAGRAAAIFYLKHPELGEYLNLRRIADPKFKRDFYDAVLDYYYLVGIMHGLRHEKADGSRAEDGLDMEDGEGRWDMEWKLAMVEKTKLLRRRVEELEGLLEDKERIIKAGKVLDKLGRILPRWFIRKIKAGIGGVSDG